MQRGGHYPQALSGFDPRREHTEREKRLCETLLGSA